MYCLITSLPINYCVLGTNAVQIAPIIWTSKLYAKKYIYYWFFMIGWTLKKHKNLAYFLFYMVYSLSFSVKQNIFVEWCYAFLYIILTAKPSFWSSYVREKNVVSIKLRIFFPLEHHIIFKLFWKEQKGRLQCLDGNITH
jgi:hypothetical protein